MSRNDSDEIEMRETFAARLDRIMVARNLTIAALSKLSDVPKSTLGKYLRKETTTQIHTLSKIGKALNVTTDYLLGRSETVVEKLSPVAKECAEKISGMSSHTQQYFLLLTISVAGHIEAKKKERNFTPEFINNL